MKGPSTMTVTVLTEPDGKGRQRFDAEWLTPVGEKRGQCFNTHLAPRIAEWRAQGYTVVVVVKR